MRALMDEHRYAPSQIYNMDESGFAVGTSQASRALVNVRDKSSWKKIQGRQEWITAIEVVDAAGFLGPHSSSSRLAKGSVILRMIVIIFMFTRIYYW